MTEQEWLVEAEPKDMLLFLRSRGMIPLRKGRLFACATCRRIWGLLTDERARLAVGVMERYADGLASDGEVAAAAHRPDNDTFSRLKWYAGWAVVYLTHDHAPEEVAASAATAARLGGKQEEREQAALLRDIVGNPFAAPPRIDPNWLAWNGGTIPKLAEAAYQERALPSGHLDPDRLVVLADALEEAGCNEAALLGHLRGPGPCVRGCHVLDLLTGREGSP